MLITSIFSFSYIVFKWLLFQGCLKSELCGKELSILIPVAQILTRDAGIIEIGADVYYSIKDVTKSITSVQDLNSSIRALVRTTVTNKLVKNDLEDIENKRFQLVKDILVLMYSFLLAQYNITFLA